MYWSVEGETFPQPACNIRVKFSEEKRVISPDYYMKHICQIPSLFRCVLLAIFSRLPLLIPVNFDFDTLSQHFDLQSRAKEDDCAFDQMNSFVKNLFQTEILKYGITYSYTFILAYLFFQK